MLREIDSTELIACLAFHESTEKKNSSIRIKLSNLAKVARGIEARYPSICVDIDKYSIESFRCKCINAITVTPTEVELNLANQHLKQIITKYKPSQQYQESIINIFTEIK